MDRPIRWYDYFTINSYWLGLSTIAQTMTPLVFPLLVQQFVGEQQKGTFFGTLRLWGLMVALLVQALAGLLSDRSTVSWGRRRPFILVGTIGDLLFISAIGLAAGLSGMAGYWVLFAMAIMLQISSNIAHGAVQGLIPDLVPPDRRGRFSAVKAIFELPLPIVLVAFSVAKLIEAGHMWAGLLVAMGVLTLAMVLTMWVPEKRLQEEPSRLDWAPFVRLVGMTALFTAIILFLGAAMRTVGGWLSGIDSIGTLIVLMGLVGLGAMVVAVALGVWVSVRISIGTAAAQRRPAYTWWVVNRLAYLVGTTNLSGFAIYFLQGRLGLVEEEAAGPAANLMMVVGLLILLMALPSGWLADRFGHWRLVALSGVVAAVGTMVALLSTNMLTIYIGGCLIGGATGVFFTANWALGTELVPPNEAGRYLGISNLAGAGAGAVGAYIGGPIADFFTTHAPDRPGLGYMVLFGIYGVMFLLSTAALRGMVEGRGGLFRRRVP